MITPDPAVVVTAALPPPIVGQSLASAMLVEQLDIAGIRYEVVDLGRPIMNGAGRLSRVARLVRVAQFPVEAARAARRLGNDVVFYLQLAHGRRGMVRDLPLLAQAVARGWPLVLHVHGGGFREELDAASWPLRRAVARLVGRAARVVVLEPRLRRMFEGLVDPSRVRVVSNAVPDELVRHASPPQDPRDGLTVLFLSNLMKKKGYGAVLEAARLCQQRGARHKFVLAGAHTDEMDIDPDEFIARHGLTNTRYEGAMFGAEKVAVLQQADAFVLPSSYREGQPIAILEAMTYGLPVITSPSGGIPDIFDCTLQAELFVEPDDPYAIVERLDRLATDTTLYRRVATDNYEQARASFTAAAHGRAMLTLLREAAALGRV